MTARPRFAFDAAGRIRPEHAADFYRHYPELSPDFTSDEPTYCAACEGSGEGAFDGATCSTCNGKGER